MLQKRSLRELVNIAAICCAVPPNAVVPPNASMSTLKGLLTAEGHSGPQAEVYLMGIRL